MGDSSEESWTMHESVIQLYRVDEEGYFACKVLSAINMFLHGAIMTALAEEAPANFCASSRVIQRGQVLFGIIGRKWRVGCTSLLSVKSPSIWWVRLIERLY